MEDLYLFNTVEGVGPELTYIEPRKGPVKLEDVGLTLVHPFYNEPERFLRQLEVWRGWSDYVRDRVRIVVIDDGSPNPVHTYIDDRADALLAGLNFSIHRITKDLKWNTPGALNLGLHMAPTDWVLIMDSDCAFTNGHMKVLLGADPEPFAVYKFPRERQGRDRSENLKNKRFLPCTMLFHRSVFEGRLGGFDEDYTGEYSGGYAFFDTDFDERAFGQKDRSPMFIWNSVTATEWMPSLAGYEIVARTSADERKNRELLSLKRVARRKYQSVRNPSPILRFEWETTYSRSRP